MTNPNLTDIVKVVRNQERPELFVTSWMSHENFRTYHVLTARKLGSVNAAILLSDLVAYYKYHKDKDLLENHAKHGKNWTPYSCETCEERTALSRKEQDTALSVLIRNGLVEKEVFGVPGKRYFRINFFSCEEMMLSKNVSRMTETDKLECPKGANCNDRNGQSNICNEMSNEMLRKENIYKRKFGEHVELTEQEYESLCNKLGKSEIESLIEQVNDYVSNHKPYKDYAAAIRTFHRNKKQELKGGLVTSFSVQKKSPGHLQKDEFGKSIVHPLELIDWSNTSVAGGSSHGR